MFEGKATVLPNTRLDIEYVPISALKKNPRNARSHSPEQIAKLRASISNFGFLVPVVVDEQSMLLCGHARVTAAEKLGLSTVPAGSRRQLAGNSRPRCPV